MSKININWSNIYAPCCCVRQRQKREREGRKDFEKK